MPRTFSTFLPYTTGPKPPTSSSFFSLPVLRAFSGLQKLIFMDSTDLEFFSDIKELQVSPACPHEKNILDCKYFEKK